MYFNTFPKIDYTFDDGDTFITLTDITVRARIVDKYLNNAAYYYFYALSDGATPEAVANEVYGSPYYHWVVLLSNDVIDPRLDWLMSDRVLREYTIEKYRVDGWTDEEILFGFHHYENSDGMRRQVRAWAADRSYILGDFVEYEGKMWRAQVAHTSAAEQPPGTSVNWSLYAGTGFVTNYEFERRRNESHREIKLLQPIYLNQMVQEFISLMKK